MSNYQENYEDIFDGKVKPGSYKQDPETGKLLTHKEWWYKYVMPFSNMYGRAPAVMDDIEPYQSPIDDTVVSGRRQQRYDLRRSNSRIYEGRETEQKEADNYTADKWKKYEASLEKALWETSRDLRYQQVEKQTRIKSGWTIGEGD
jgi:hypothetical protein